jgi:SAM-dependent methyltransferase
MLSTSASSPVLDQPLSVPGLINPTTMTIWLGAPAAVPSSCQSHPLPAGAPQRYRTPIAPGRASAVLVGPVPAALSDDAVLALVLEASRIATGPVALLVTPAAPRDQAWWENLGFLVNLRKHPAFQTSAPTDVLTALTPWLDSAATTPVPKVLLFEKMPLRAAAQHPLAALRAERDLHNDMLREPGRRAEAHTRRYTLAREWVQPGMRVLDAACGLGYGAPILRAHPDVSITGVDTSDFAVAYARLHYARPGSAERFLKGDASRLEFAADATFDLVTSFETIEHVIDPAAFLAELARVLKPGGHLVLSVPNRWIDEQGRNPVPWHLHVYDFTSLARQVGVDFELQHVYRQNAGGGWKRDQADAFVHLPDLNPTATDRQDAEWWVIVAQRPAISPDPTFAPTAVTVEPVAPAQPRLLVLDEPARHFELFGRALDLLGAEKLALPTDFTPEAVVALAPDAVLLSREWTPEWRLTAAACRAASIPVIYVMDGVIEWSYLWNNLSHIRPGGTFLQPLIADHLCVIGRHPARILASLGLASRLHVIGLPRLDGYDRSRHLVSGAKPTVLVATARTAGHDPEQQIMARRALTDLKAFFDGTPGIKPIWRIAADLAEDIGVTADITGSFADVVARVHGVITLPSTCVLEAMLKGVPVAQLDYRPAPAYVATAWDIRAADHIPAVVQELLYPPPQKLAWQDACLADELELGDASARLAEIVTTSIRERGQASAADSIASAAGNGRLDFHQVHSELSTFAAAHSTTLAYELDATHRLLRESRDLRRDETRDAVELAEAALSHDLRDLRRHALIDNLTSATVHAEQAGAVSSGPATLQGRTSRTLFMAAPAQVTWTLPTGEKGLLALAVSLHPDVWTNPQSGPTRFTVKVDQITVAEVELDARDDEAARRWHWINVPVAAAEHAHVIALSALGLGDQAFRWTLWRNPVFLWTDPTPEIQDASRPLAARRTDYYVPGRTVI